jgi:hypothetical protein
VGTSAAWQTLDSTRGLTQKGLFSSRAVIDSFVKPTADRKDINYRLHLRSKCSLVRVGRDAESMQKNARLDRLEKELKLKSKHQFPSNAAPDFALGIPRSGSRIQ